MGKKLLGIDYGSKKVGIAITDDMGSIAFPREVIANDNKMLSLIEKLIMEENIDGIVIGESLDYKGEKNKIMESIEYLKEALQKRYAIPVYFEPEFLSTKEAFHVHEENTKPDAGAAAVILQSFIDKNKKE